MMRDLLISDPNHYSVIGVHRTGWFDIDSRHYAIGSKIVEPHHQTAPAIDAYFNEMHLASYKPAKMLLVQVEIMDPFVDPQTASVIIKVVT